MTRTLKLASVFGVACSLLIMPRISLAEGGGVDIAGMAGSAFQGAVGTVSDIGGSIVGGVADIAGTTGSALMGTVGTVSNIGSSIVGGAADIAGMAGSALLGTVETVSNIAGTGLLSIGKVISDVSSLMVGWPVLDLASVPAHAIVSIEQEFIRMRTEIEDETKQQIKERLSATKNNMGQKIDTQMSNAKILSEEANKLVSEGIVDKGIDVGGKGEIEADAEKETFDLAMQQQANWTSAAGSLRAKDEYSKKRAYIEQEQAIRLLGTIGVLRKNIEEHLMSQTDGPLKHLDDNYNQSDAKKDLDPNGDSATVEKTNDYNQALRQYAFNGLVYDQFLSLEQQIMGLRLQAVAGRNAQDLSPLSDKLEVTTQSDEAETDK